MDAILFEDKKCRIDPDLCTEYYECLRMKVCPEGAIYAQDLEGFYKEFQHVLSDPVETHGVTGVTGRGTDEGISIIVSGLIDRVGEITREMGLDPHNINVSLGIIGKTDRLPPADIRQYTTMCGHGMVAVGLIKKVLSEVQSGDLSPEKAAEKLFEPCVCGAFNPVRAAEILRELDSNR